MYKNINLDEVELTPIMGFDTEFNDLDTKHAKLIAFSLTNENEKTYVFDCGLYTKEQLTRFFEKLSTVGKLISHNTKVEIGVVYSNTGVLLRNCWCTMLASQIIDNGYGYPIAKEDVEKRGFEIPSGYEKGKLMFTKNMVGGIPVMQGAHSLLGCIKRYLGNELISAKDKKLLQLSFINYDFKNPLTEEQLKYAGEDTIYLIPLYKAQSNHIEERKLKNIIALENKLTPVLVKMEFRGCKIDIELHKKNIIKWANKLEEITASMDEIVFKLATIHPGIGKFNFNRTVTIIQQTDLFGLPKQITVGQEAFNYSSSKQLGELFTACQQELPKDDAAKASFGEESISFYITNKPDSIFVDLLNLLLEYREYEKLLGTYSEKILDNLDEDHIRTSYSQCWTATGRLASAEIKSGLGLNLANIPKNPDIRKIFIPEEGYVFIDSDMTGQELIIAGDFAKEPVLLKAFQEGFDHHSFLASISYGIIFEKETEIKNISEEITVGSKTYNVKKLRDEHKACLFSKIYLGGPKRIQVILNKYLVNHVVPKERFNVCKKISEALDLKLGTLIKFLKQKVEETKENGYTVANKLGRRRYFDNPDKVYGDAANMPIQGTGADAIKIAMIRIDEFFETKSKELGISEHELGFLTLSVYDQVLVNLNKKYIDYKDEIPRIMGEALTYFLTTLKGSSDINVREYWGK